MSHSATTRNLWYFLVLGLLLAPHVILGQQSDAKPQISLSEWGPDDQKGAKNRITSSMIVRAANLITEGEIYELGQTYENSMPLGGRTFHLNIPGSPSVGPIYDNNMLFNFDFFAGELGQIGTQFDALGHAGFRHGQEDHYYNGHTGAEIYSGNGLKKLGVEHAGAFFTRGVLIDVAGFKEVERLEPGYEISKEDIVGSLKKQNSEINEGDVVLIRTGHSKLWKVDNDLYYATEPGIGVSAGRWLADQKVVIIGADNFGIEVTPPATSGIGWPIHQMMLAENGIYLLESLNLEELSKDQVYEFAFMFSPLPLKGATGSPGNPIAIK